MKIFNSLTKKKEVFKPIEARKVKIYVCGITVYDYSHIGHARSLVIFDMVVRYFQMRGYEVTFVRNVTDIDDKIIKSAQALKENAEALSERFIQVLHEDEKKLCVLSPDIEPRVTQHIPEVIKIIEKLIKKQYAYIGKNGDVYFNICRFSEYGRLSRRNLDQFHTRSGTRVSIDVGKHSSLDFVLWKQARLGEPRWKSPWGDGRPGWHIGCSAMSSSLLGQPFDIHGGGVDLKFPHHENEIAQSEAAEEKKFVNLWMHLGLLEIDKVKMSKSLGNTISIREALEKNNVETLRYFLLSSHYRSSVNYSEKNLSNSYLALERFYLGVYGLPSLSGGERVTSEYTSQFYKAMDDDFNTPIAFSILFAMVREINRFRNANLIEKARVLAVELKRLSSVFGLLTYPPERFLQKIKTPDAEKIETLIAARNKVRRNKNWKSADKIRDQLAVLGVWIRDVPGGDTLWWKH